ncbi:MAG: 30S ribosomal protein S20 [Clostridia bacterium]|nr:30S ribosomal protein S20 [Clostridia bacterium]
MPNIKSAKKRVKVIATKTLQNQMVKTNLKTTIKKFEAAVAAGDKEQCQALYRLTVKKLDQAVAKGILKKNTASRKKSQMTLKFNKIGA